MLARPARKAAAVALVAGAAAAVVTDDAGLVVDALDVTAAAVLAVAGVDPDAAREILGTLWAGPDR